MSAFNPLTAVDRHELANQMVASQIAFFPVPLGIRLDPTTLHGLANGTGGMVLRTALEEEKLVDALKRYEKAFAGAVLYNAKLQLPAEMTEVCPSVLPPLRADSPTLVVGRMKAPFAADRLHDPGDSASFGTNGDSGDGKSSTA